ncbi:MAG: hypothetical protein LWX83_14635, partial [Anaerolineae bacterium]|nr:hypothetical protein [Anaerolineae bacterium]
MSNNFSVKSGLSAARLGAALGFCAALLYGLAFVIYGIIRTSIWILRAPANDLPGTLLANALCVLIGSMFFAVFFGLFAALFQGLTLSLLYTLQKRLPSINGRWLGLGLALLLFIVLLLVFQSLPVIAKQVFWDQSFFFWFGLPGLIYL